MEEWSAHCKALKGNVPSTAASLLNGGVRVPNLSHFGLIIMCEFHDSTIFGATFDEFSKSLTSAIQSLPPEMGKRLRAIRRNYFGWYGLEGTYKRLNGRTVGQIFAEYDSLDIKPIASGEVDGVTYRLYAARPGDPERGQDPEP